MALYNLCVFIPYIYSLQALCNPHFSQPNPPIYALSGPFSMRELRNKMLQKVETEVEYTHRCTNYPSATLTSPILHYWNTIHTICTIEIQYLRYGNSLFTLFAQLKYNITLFALFALLKWTICVIQINYSRYLHY